MRIDDAIDVFARGLCTLKSAAHPYLPEKTRGLWVLRDGPGRKDPRTVQVIASRATPAEIAATVEEIGMGWHFLCDMREPGEDLAGIRAAYKSLGYRAQSTEWMFAHDLHEFPNFNCEPPVREVRSSAEALGISQLASQKVKLLPDTRLFGIWDDNRDFGWVRSIPVGSAAYTAGLYVHRDARRRGYGRALMSAILQATRESGLANDVLMAGSEGARLYPHLGYKEVGVLQLFCPLRASSRATKGRA